ncbi:hypothetical protein H9P43_001695 [Blastocladiella emersonii ATCC 22665]|nr:hypothetical protein H9P43_001695 [Blastocladiella emersonii ATCC 22665]
MIIKAPERPIAATHCLFDMDGLLLNTEDIYTEASLIVLERYGKTYDWSLKARMMGLREDDAAELFIKETGIPMTAQEYLVERHALHASLFPKCVPLPGVVRLVRHLRAQGVPIAVATSSHRAPFEIKTKNNQHLFTLFDGNVTTGDDAAIKRGKPAPDLFLAGHAQLGRADHERATAIVFEDAPSGVLAGINAGMPVVWVRDSRLPRDAELEAKCWVVIESMEEFDPAWMGVAPFPVDA